MTDPTTPQRLSMRGAILGEGMQIMRALPQRARRTVGAWCFMDHAGPVQFAPGEGMHVGAHPHIGLQTFTWMIEGEIVHRDSLGNEQVIRPGQVNLMTAGRGIAHTEDSLHEGGRLHAAQLWIALPAAEARCEPAFQHCPQLPVLDAGGFRATVLAGSALGQTSPVTVHTPLLGVDLGADGPAQARLPLRPDFEHAVLPLRGAVQAAGETVEPGSWLYFAPGRDTLELRCDAAAQLLLVGGVPFDEPLIIWWNLVARTQAEIEAAMADWNAGRFAPVRPGSPAAALPAPSLEGARLQAR